MTEFLPQIILLLLAACGVGIVLAKNGEPRPNYSFFSYSLAIAVELGLLYWGGFFKGMF